MNINSSAKLNTGAILLAAGKSTRFGTDKQMSLLNGKPVLWYSLNVLHLCPLIDTIVVIASTDNITAVSDYIKSLNFSKVVSVTAGGLRRQDSVLIGIKALSDLQNILDIVVVHDSARPFATTTMVKESIELAALFGGSAPAVPVNDTIKSAFQKNNHLVVNHTLDRSNLYAIQTPQAFKYTTLEKAHIEIHQECTDDCAMLERIGTKVALFQGSYENIKITYPSDMVFANAIAIHKKYESMPTPEQWRWGTGFDCHQFSSTTTNKLRLGGIDINFPTPLHGHSDGDVVLHAVASSILGAAGLGDLGRHFPSSSMWKDADSRKILEICVKKAHNQGWQIQHIDATIIAEVPRLAPYQQAMEQSIADTVKIPPQYVNVKVTSTDKLGTIGQAKGIAAQAISTLKKDNII